VESFKQDELDCNIWEEDVDGYTASYSANTDVAGSATDDDDGCYFDNIGNSNYPSEVDDNQCDITNYPNPVQVLVHKDWVIEGSGGDILDPTYKLTLRCDDEEACVKNSGGVVVDEPDNHGNTCKIYLTGDDIKGYGNHHTTTSDDDLSYTALVIPDWEYGTNCWVDEEVYDSSVEVDNGCEQPFVEVPAGDSGPAYPLHVEIGDADDSNECTITNTVFYEGIPTLSQYGMAIMALLMLGVGFVGFRRFV
jgi:hypothetical protein